MSDASSSTQIVGLGSYGNTVLIERTYREVLVPAFRPEELPTLVDFREHFVKADGAGVVGLCACREANEPVGCIIGYQYPLSGALLIGYLAVRTDLRDRGIGSMLLEGARSMWFSASWCSFVLAELDDPRFYPPGDADPERRVVFYARHGAELICAPYFQPRVQEDLSRVYDMLLVVLKARPTVMVTDTAQGTHGIRSDVVLQFLEEYFTASEGPESVALDPEVRWLFDRYRERNSIQVIPLGSYRTVDFPRLPIDSHNS